MADVAEEDRVLAACSSLLAAAILGAATILKERSIQCPFVRIGHTDTVSQHKISKYCIIEVSNRFVGLVVFQSPSG